MKSDSQPARPHESTRESIRESTRTSTRTSTWVAPLSLRRGLAIWRRSIQFRVVASTVLLSLLVIGAVGWLLLLQTRDGLLSNRVQAAIAEAANETAEARGRLARAPGTETDAASQRRDLVAPIQARGQSRGFAVVLAGPVLGQNQPGRVLYTPGLEVASLPNGLVQHFGEQASPAWSYADIKFADPDAGASGPAVVVGSQVKLPADGNTYTLYYVFPLEDDAATLSLVTRAVTTAGLLLPILIALLVWAVARQVITPVRLARQTAEKIAAGLLRERMTVRGEDDLARLGSSLNQMASSLQQQITQLEDLSHVQQRFVSDVSHELRTPLTTVRMASDVLHDVRAALDPGAARAAELLQTELDRFETLLADLLEISRFDAGAAVLDLTEVDLAEVAKHVAESVRALAEARGIQIVVHHPDHPCLAQADVRRVERIVRNLLTNAIDHAESGDVEVRIANDETVAALSVRDWGVGLKAGQAALVFNRFWRADPARARTSGGTGLGLSISLEDALAHGGWLQAWGEPHVGTVFRLTLPRISGGPVTHSPLPLHPVDRQPQP
jgi:two-component system, OmpR family, sensor histidine kinase MtrB